MPRKKPDLTPWKKDDSPDGIFARMTYFHRTGENYTLRMRDSPKNQRTVKCNSCGIVIPRDVPRLQREGSWYEKGHLCMDCGKSELTMLINRMKAVKDLAQEFLTLGKALRICAEEVSSDPRYKDKLAMGKMLQMMGKDKRYAD